MGFSKNQSTSHQKQRQQVQEFCEAGFSAFTQYHMQPAAIKGWRQLKRGADSKATNMKKIVILIIAFGFCLSDPGTDENDRVCQVAGSASCCNICSLTSVTQKVGELGEKVVNMAEKITFLETRLQNTEKEVLELRSLTGGSKSFSFTVKYNYCMSSFPMYFWCL